MPARHVVFVGAMGAGKSTIGRRVAAALDRPFVDNDEALEDSVGMSAADLSGRAGVHELHRIEAAIVLDALNAVAPAVIAAAASTIDDAGVREALRLDAWVAWLRAEPDVLIERLPRSATRPFADHDPVRLVHEQARERNALFAEVADATFDTDPTDAASDDGIARLVARVLAAASQAGF